MNKIYGLKMTGNGKTWMDLFYSTHEKAEEGRKEWKSYYYNCVIEIKEITLDLKKEDFNQFKKEEKIKKRCDFCEYFLENKFYEDVVFGKFEPRFGMYCKLKKIFINGTLPTAMNCKEFKPKNYKTKVWYCIDCGLYLNEKPMYYLTRKKLFKKHKTVKSCRWLVSSTELSNETLKKDGKM